MHLSKLFIYKNGFSFFILVASLLMGAYAHYSVAPIWQEQTYIYQIYQNNAGDDVYKFKGRESAVGEVIAYQQSPLRQSQLDLYGKPAGLD